MFTMRLRTKSYSPVSSGLFCINYHTEGKGRLCQSLRGFLLNYTKRYLKCIGLQDLQYYLYIKPGHQINWLWCRFHVTFRGFSML
jgi:hypothetical protein